LHEYSHALRVLLQTLQDNITSSTSAGVPAQLSLNLLLLPQLVSKMQLKVDVVRDFTRHMVSQASAQQGARGLAQLWQAWSRKADCPEVQVSGLLQAVAVDSMKGSDGQQQDIMFTVAGWHVAAFNMLAYALMMTPGRQLRTLKAALWSAALPDVLTQLDALAGWHAESSSSSRAEIVPRTPLQISSFHLELLSIFGNAAAGVEYTDVHSLGSFEARFSYLYSLAARLPGQWQAFAQRAKPTKVGQWLVLTGPAGAAALAAAAAGGGDGAAQASQASVGSSTSSSSRVYGRVLERQWAGWRVELGTRFEANALKVDGVTELSDTQVCDSGSAGFSWVSAYSYVHVCVSLRPITSPTFAATAGECICL
jgi:hypothetical protein